MKNKSDNDHEPFNWKAYYDLHMAMPHTKSLATANVKYCNGPRGVALDIGAGNLRDTKYLLQEGFKVIAVDPSPDSAAMAKELHNPNLTMIEDIIGKYNFPKEYFQVVNAQGFLFHLRDERLVIIMNRIKSSLQKGGIFTTELLGKNDDWNTIDSTKTFLDRSELEELFDGFEIKYLDEYERDVTSAKSEINGTNELKHWHKFKIIAVKQ